MTEPNPITLRPYQEEALQAVEHCLQAGTTRVIISTPTGTGKAVVTAQLPRRLGTPLLLLTHREELLDQHERHMRQANPTLRIGIEHADRYAHSTNDVILASIPTLAARGGRRLAYLTTIPWKAVVVDEVHHAPAQTWRRVIDALGCLAPQGPPLIGTSATLRRGDGVGLEQLFEQIAYQKSLRDMIDDGWCCDLRAFAIHTDVSLDHVRMRHGDFAEGPLAHTVNTPQPQHDDRRGLAPVRGIAPDARFRGQRAARRGPGALVPPGRDRGTNPHRRPGPRHAARPAPGLP